MFIHTGLFAQSFGGNPPGFTWISTHSDNATLLFPQQQSQQAKRIHSILEALHTESRSRTGENLLHWPVILQSHTQIPNAYVRLAPVMSELNMTASQDNFSLGSLRWEDNLMLHEHRHMEQFSRFNHGLTRAFRWLLGQEGQLLANGITIPDYFFEGDAVWRETELSWQGRGRLPHFFNIIRANAYAKKSFRWMTWRSGSLRHQLPDHYTLGYILVTYAHNRYGQPFWDSVTRDAVRFRGLLYAFNQSIRRHSGMRYAPFTDSALQYFHQSLAIPSKEAETIQWISVAETGNVLQDQFPQPDTSGHWVFSRASFRKPAGFYTYNRGTIRKIRSRDISLDNYFSLRNNQIVYSAYHSDPRWYNRNYTDLRLISISNGKQKKLTRKSRYQSPDLSPDGKSILAVANDFSRCNSLHILDAADGKVQLVVPNPDSLYFTQTIWMDSSSAVSAVRRIDGRMSLVKVRLADGAIERLLPYTERVLGYPRYQADTIWFTAQDLHSDQLMAYVLSSGNTYRIYKTPLSAYAPAADGKGRIMASMHTADGLRLFSVQQDALQWELLEPSFWSTPDYGAYPWQSRRPGPVFSDTLQEKEYPVQHFSKASKLFSFHSWRPLADDPDWGYQLYSDNILSSLSAVISYTYNRVERSHGPGARLYFAQWYPVIGIGTDFIFNRTLDTAAGKPVSFHSWNRFAQIYIPWQWIAGRGRWVIIPSLSIHADQLYYPGIGKNILDNQSFEYLQYSLQASRFGLTAAQRIYPFWGQSVSLNFRDAISGEDRRKLTLNSRFYFPGIFRNQSIVLQYSYQRRDSLPDIFSNTFSYARGYDALSTRKMQLFGINYHLPLAYPDWGFGNIYYIQRVRINLFYDHVLARARLNNQLTNITNRSTGLEMYLDGKIWNSLPLTLGIRYSRLLDTNLRNPALQNRWEIILPVGIIPD